MRFLTILLFLLHLHLYKTDEIEDFDSPTGFPILYNSNPNKVRFEVETDEGIKYLRPLPVRSNKSCFKLKVGRLLFFSVAKSMSSTMKLILCELALKDRGLDLPKDFLIKHPDHSYEACLAKINLSELNHQPPMIGLKRFFIWRDPIDRFSSMYAYLCVLRKQCGSAGESIHEAAKGFYEFLKDGKIPEGAKDLTHLRHHIAPTSWYCDIGGHSKQIKMIEYSTDSALLSKRLLRLFDSAGIKRKWSRKGLERFLRPKMNASQNDEQRLELRREIIGNPKTLAYLLAIYYYDYYLFGKTPKLE